MKSRPHSFNLYFTLLCLALTAGCSTDKASVEKREQKKEQSTIRFYLEDHSPGSSGIVLVTRQRFPMSVEREPFMTEEDISKASIINDPLADGTYSIQINFNDHGTLLLDMYTTANKGKHIVIFAQFPKPGEKPPKVKEKKDLDDDLEENNLPASAAPADPNKPREAAWMAAVMIRGRISNGMLRFTPDATHEEGVRIVRGLKNVIALAKKMEKF